MDHNQVQDAASFADYLSQLRAESNDCSARERWENTTLPAFLEAMEAWARAWPHPADGNPWRHAANLLTAASIYE
jgi:hypothetical protein